jgi:hypothetical protein
MGEYFFDQYSILHLASGIVAYFFNINLLLWLIIHILFEVIENTNKGIYIINNYLLFWPGGKPKSDSIINSIGDTVFGIVGWYIAYLFDKYYKNKK